MKFPLEFTQALDNFVKERMLEETPNFFEFFGVDQEALEKDIADKLIDLAKKGEMYVKYCYLAEAKFQGPGYRLDASRFLPVESKRIKPGDLSIVDLYPEISEKYRQYVLEYERINDKNADILREFSKCIQILQFACNSYKDITKKFPLSLKVLEATDAELASLLKKVCK